MSHILTEDLAKSAVRIVMSSIDGILACGLTEGRRNLHIVILNPSNGEILYEVSECVDPETSWKHPYAAIARSKAQISYRTGLTTRNVVTNTPWLYETGDTRYPGSAVEDGLVVAVSGLQNYFDELISWMVLKAIQALCRHEVAKIPNDAPDFFSIA